MAKAQNPPRGTSLQIQLRAMEAKVAQLSRRLSEQEARIRALTRAMETRARREDVVLRALGIGPSSRRGDRGIVGQLDASVAKLEEYLLRTGDRIEAILKILGSHRESLEKVNRKLDEAGNKELLRMELELMKANLAILAMSGVEFDADLVSDIEELKKAADDAKVNIDELRRRKGELDKKYQAELQRYDLGSLYRKRVVPGYV